MSTTPLVLTLVEYAYGEATFETDDGDVSLSLPLMAWETIGRPETVRVTAEVDR